jgi:hypothetical protein
MLVAKLAGWTRSIGHRVATDAPSLDSAVSHNRRRRVIFLGRRWSGLVRQPPLQLIAGQQRAEVSGEVSSVHCIDRGRARIDPARKRDQNFELDLSGHRDRSRDCDFTRSRFDSSTGSEATRSVVESTPNNGNRARCPAPHLDEFHNRRCLGLNDVYIGSQQVRGGHTLSTQDGPAVVGGGQHGGFPPLHVSGRGEVEPH